MTEAVLVAIIVALITMSPTVLAIIVSHWRLSAQVGTVESVVNGNTLRLQERIAVLEDRLNEIYKAQPPESMDVSGHAWGTS